MATSHNHKQQHQQQQQATSLPVHDMTVIKPDRKPEGVSQEGKQVPHQAHRQWSETYARMRRNQTQQQGSTVPRSPKRMNTRNDEDGMRAQPVHMKPKQTPQFAAEPG